MPEEAISWMTLASGTPIKASDGTELGRVHEVVADRQKDIFSGITFRDGVLGADRFVPAHLIGEITTDEVRLTVTGQDAGDEIEPYDR
ncbi:MAG: DUF2171 domain-containing protein [Actinobacteria bacterium]|nr:DUF2171 domain-containing protein [Actinomycetota bacterium]